MRVCRFEHRGQPQAGFYDERQVLSLAAVAKLTGVALPDGDDLLPLLPGGSAREAVRTAQTRLEHSDPAALDRAALPIGEVRLLVPVAQPSKLILLAGNYSKHIEEGGGRAAERRETFPYLFLKPPTTLTHPGDPIRIPSCSPEQIDWEIELGVIIGRTVKDVSEAAALDCVAGYTVVNDISDRGFHPNPGRVDRPKDEFFDWQHGKWHDTFCPIGPCVLPADETPDPQRLPLRLSVNGTVEQDASTAQMIFPVAAVIEFVSRFVTLVPGDIISTGTPHGVGKAKGKFLKPGDRVEAAIDGIGVLRNPVV